MNIKRLILLTGSAVALSLNLAAQSPFGHPDSSETRGIFGADNRKEAKQVLGYEGYTKATTAMMPANKVIGDKIYGPTLRDNLITRFGVENFAEDVKFLDQPAISNCTGFLIAPDIMVTAGHCIETKADCKEWVWVMDYTADVSYNTKSGYINMPADKRYRCKDILATRLTDGNSPQDYAIIRLDRETDRIPYRFRTSLKPTVNQAIDMIGAPSGIPLKLVDSAIIVRNADPNYFVTNLDAFPGNSGGPVFNKDGYIEGILVRGPRNGDYEYNSECNCIQSVKYSQLGKENPIGIQVNRITNIPFNVQKEAIYSSIRSFIRKKDDTNLKLWMDYTWFFRQQPEGREDLMLIAAKNYYSPVIQILLTADADFNVKDSAGNPFLHYIIRNNDVAAATAAAATKDLNVNAVNAGNENAAHISVETGASRVLLEPLVKAGLDLNARNSYGNTPLHMAVNSNNAAALENLLALGANPKITDGSGLTPRDLAKKLKNKSLKKKLKKAEKKRK